MNEKGCSQRRACALFGIAPSVYRYKSRRDDDGPLRKQIKETTDAHHRYGYRRVYRELLQEGRKVSLDKVCQLYKEWVWR